MLVNKAQDLSQKPFCSVQQTPKYLLRARHSLGSLGSKRSKTWSQLSRGSQSGGREMRHLCEQLTCNMVRATREVCAHVTGALRRKPLSGLGIRHRRAES